MEVVTYYVQEQAKGSSGEVEPGLCRCIVPNRQGVRISAGAALSLGERLANDDSARNDGTQPLDRGWRTIPEGVD